MAFKCHKQIKEKNLGTESNQADLSRARLVPATVMKFEKQLYERINKQLLKSPMSYDTVQILRPGDGMAV